MTCDSEKIQNFGKRRLSRIKPTTEIIDSCKAFLVGYQPSSEFSDDAYVWLTCALALEAVDGGNFGVGGILIDEGGDVVAQGHNEVFNPYFRSDRHSEMVVMDHFEDANPKLTSLKGYTFYSSLEPCPMCLVRLSTSGVRKVLYAAPDVEGGMISRMSDLPPLWLELCQTKTFAQAQCSQDLINVATQLFLFNLDELFATITKR